MYATPPGGIGSAPGETVLAFARPDLDAVALAPAANEHAVARLWTRNVEHFPMFANLTPLY